MTAYIAYYRVSTDRQGASGLGLDAQREAVSQHIGNTRLLAEYTEIESGRKAKRPQLAASLQECKKRKATLIIAKLDQLGRDVAFISALMDSGAEFICCGDNPRANRLVLHMLAAFAKHEREQISLRTKAALVAAKARGVRLGNPRPLEALQLAHAVHRSCRLATELRPFMRTFQQQGMSFRAIGLRRMNRHLE